MTEEEINLLYVLKRKLDAGELTQKEFDDAVAIIRGTKKNTKDTNTSEPSQETAPAKKEKQGKKKGVIVVAIIAAMVLLALGLFLVLHNSSTRSEEQNTAEASTKENVIESKTDITIEVQCIAIPMKLISGGTFTMGGSLEGIDYKDNELPAHSMEVESFYMSVYEVTQQLWTAVMETNPSEFIGEQNPVENVSWYDCVEFTKKLSSLTGRKFRLPTEAEWEYAAKGGSNQENFEFAGSNYLWEVAWCVSNSEKRTHSVGHKKCNGCGLYDMSGNVYEWCSSWYAPYVIESMYNPLGPDGGEDKVFRGGSCKYSDTYCRITYRPHTNPNGRYNNLGLRLVLEIPQK